MVLMGLIGTAIVRDALVYFTIHDFEYGCCSESGRVCNRVLPYLESVVCGQMHNYIKSARR